jgi:hypothetical protein
MKPGRKNQGHRAKKKVAERGSKVRVALETVLVTAAILLIPLFFAVQSGAIPLGARNAAAPQEPVAASVPPLSPSPGTIAEQPPQCTFPLWQTMTAEATPENYAFSEPRVVLTAPKGNIYNVGEWLPDNRHVLITEALRSDAMTGAVNPESIELLNPETGETPISASRPETHEPPSWDATLNAVVFPVINYYLIDQRNHVAKFTRQIWVSYGNPDTAEMLVDNAAQLPIAVKPSGNEIVYISDGSISRLDMSLNRVASVPFNAAQWDYARPQSNNDSPAFHMLWQPGTPLIFLYSRGYMGAGGYTFILNSETGSICELSLGGWASVARWSSNGRFLAIGMVENSNPAKPAVLDTVTGNLTVLGESPQGAESRLYMSDLIWTPDNLHLLLIGNAILRGTTQEQGLFLADTETGQSTRVADYESVVSSQNSNWAWSPDGSKLLLRCPTHTVDQLCLVSVQKVSP